MSLIENEGIPAPAPEASSRTLDPELLRLALVLLTGAVAVVLDTTIVSVALQTLARNLDVSVSTIQWVTTGYLLALGMAVPVSGWLLERFGGKHIWMIALAVFFLGSLGSSFAWSAASLIAFRVLQGIGGGLMLPVMQTLLVQAVGGRNLGRVTALIALPVLLGPIFGPVVGGVIVDQLSWRWIFWINIPFCVAGLLLAWRLMPADRKAGAAGRLDVTGLLLLSPGIALMLFGLSEVGVHHGFRHAAAIVPLVVGVALVGAFTIWALRRSGRPLVDVRLFRTPSFAASTALLFLSGFVLYGAMLLLPLYFQQVRGQDALGAGLLLAPQGVGALASRSLAGILSDRIGPRWIVFTGLIIVAVGTVPFALAGPSTSEWLLIGSLVVRGIGLGAVTIPLVAGAYAGLARAQIADASIITRSAQQVGGSFGGALLAVILANQLSAHPLAAPASAFATTFWWTIGLTIVALVLTIWLPSHQPE
jgi:EmrB/QacA subfamily drug resistance transporter